jgi:hypothetical protein
METEGNSLIISTLCNGAMACGMIAQSLTQGVGQWLPPLGGSHCPSAHPLHCRLLIAYPSAENKMGVPSAEFKIVAGSGKLSGQ